MSVNSRLKAILVCYSGISTQAGTMSNATILTSLKSQNFLCQPW